MISVLEFEDNYFRIEVLRINKNKWMVCGTDHNTWSSTRNFSSFREAEEHYTRLLQRELNSPRETSDELSTRTCPVSMGIGK